MSTACDKERCPGHGKCNPDSGPYCQCKCHKVCRAYDELVAKIEELVPDAGFWVNLKPLDFGLEDVLRALREAATEKAPYFDIAAPLLGAWEMGKPLSEQSPETISFLHSLLCS